MLMQRNTTIEKLKGAVGLNNGRRRRGRRTKKPVPRAAAGYA